MRETFTLPDGRVLGNVHDGSNCVDRPCVIHNPTAHRMHRFHLHWRDDRGIFERICHHGVGHPDPDQFYYWELTGRGHESIHGCDGCCSPPAATSKTTTEYGEPMYRVTYDTPTRPSDLPDGAKVEQLPREFPLKLTTNLNRELTVHKQGRDVNLHVKSIGAWGGDEVGSHLDADVARELAHAILEAIGDPVPDAPAPAPTVVRDGDGDYWVLNPRTDKWILTHENAELSSHQRDYNTGESLDYISRNYSGYTVVK